MKKHVLKKSDTLCELSALYGIPVCMIVRANGGLKEGFSDRKFLNIPQADFCSKIYGEYTVLKGDTLILISKKTSTLMREIMSLNSLSAGDLQPGMTVFLPERRNIYTVAAGDNLDLIEQKTGVGMLKLRELNDLTGGIYTGMQLRLS